MLASHLENPEESVPLLCPPFVHELFSTSQHDAARRGANVVNLGENLDWAA